MKEHELYHAVYRELCELVGLEATLKIYRHFQGQQISFPLRLYHSHLIRRKIKKEYDGKNIRALAVRYGYSEKTVRRMLRDRGD